MKQPPPPAALAPRLNRWHVDSAGTRYYATWQGGRLCLRKDGTAEGYAYDDHAAFLRFFTPID